MKVLIACEFSGIVREAFKARGHDAWSCDLIPSRIPGKHIQGDVSGILDKNWDLLIGHPPCTYLCKGGLPNITLRPELNWLDNQKEALIFFKKLYYSKIKKVALENPIGKLSTLFRPPDQVLYANYFGDQYSKDICLWLKGLPKLIWSPCDTLFDKKTTAEGELKKLDFWSTKRKGSDGGDEKSVTFQGFANAMAEQWG